MQAKILPRSLVGVTKTRTPFPDMVRIPTVFSGFDYAENTQQKNQLNFPDSQSTHLQELQEPRAVLHEVDNKIQATYLRFSSTYKVNGIGLSLETVRSIIPIPHPLGIVDTYHRRLMIINRIEHNMSM